MNRSDGLTTSCWNAGVRMPRYRALRGKSAADVCIVSAGIAGLTCAYFLAREGKSVIVLDQGPLGGGQTGRTSAHLASAIDDRLAHQSHAAAIDAIEKICTDEKIDCQFTWLDAFLSLSPDSRPDLLNKEFAAAKRAGFKDIELLGRGGMDNGPCLRFGGQAQFHPLRYLAALANLL